jgi:hypothetical protein
MASFEDGASLSGGTRTNSTVTLGGAPAENRILILTLNIEGDVAPTPPTGFKLLVNIDFTGSNAHDLWVWWKRAGASEGTGFTITHSSSWTSAWIGVIQNASTSVNPWSGLMRQGTTTTVTANGVTTLGNDACVIFVRACFDDAGAGSPPSGSTPTFSEHHDLGGNLYTASGTLATAGATGDKTQTIGGSTIAWESVLIVVEDDGTTSGAPPPWPVIAGALAAFASGTTITTTIPAGAETDDIMVLAQMANGSTTFSTPTDWTILGTSIESNSNQSSEWYWKRHDGSESDPASTTSATMSGTLGGYGRIYIFRGALTSADPFEDVTMAGSPTTDNNPDTAAIDTTGVNRLVASLLVVDDDNSWSSGNPPSGWSNLGNRVTSTTGGDCMMDALGRTEVSATSVGAATIGTMSAADYWRSITFALKPNVAGVSVDLTAGTITFSGGTIDPDPGTPTNNLTAGTITFSGGTITGVAVAPEVALTPGVITFSVGSIIVTVSPIEVELAPGVITFSAGTIDPDPGTPVNDLTAGTITFSGGTVTPQAEPPEVALAPGVITFSVGDIVGSEDEPSVVALSPGIITFSGGSISASPGTPEVTLTPGVITFGTGTLDFDNGEPAADHRMVIVYLLLKWHESTLLDLMGDEFRLDQDS